MKKIKILLLPVLFGMLSIEAWGQDLHFSQYYNAPMLVNPANTGFNPDFDFRVGVNYRNQWASVGTPYKTMSAWGDTKLLSNRIENGWIGLGGMLWKDQAGSGSLTGTTGMVSLAYHQMLGYNSLLSGGFSVGYTQKRIDVTKLTFDDQWNGVFFDANIPTFEPFATNQVSYIDLQAGINYAYFASENFYFNAGVSVMHINTPRETFFDASISNNEISRRYNVFLNASVKVLDTWILNPNIYVSMVGNSRELLAGINANRDLGDNGARQLIMGIYYRNNDALIPMFGYQINDLKMTFNYDATISSLSKSNLTRGAYEISIVKSGIFPSSQGRQTRCPSVSF
ncbi:MAG: PorP/SprF family type IX secretion system membrane protein [Bacteroidetes bacterium]|nr:PorP/SprF family type IX secretion system membrane protein [Bacteroidota bacterium]